MTWSIDGAPVRVLNYADAKGGSTFPQTPMQIKLGTWVAGKPGVSEGTIDWAGGLADFSQAPFNAYYKSITVTDYANGVKGAKQYRYGDRSGTWQSIIVDTSDVPVADDGDDKPATRVTTTTNEPSATATTPGHDDATTTTAPPSSMQTYTRPAPTHVPGHYPDEDCSVESYPGVHTSTWVIAPSASSSVVVPPGGVVTSTPGETVPVSSASTVGRVSGVFAAVLGAVVLVL